MDLSDFAASVGDVGAVTIAGRHTRGGPVEGVRTVAAPAGIDSLDPEEMTVRCGAGTPVDELRAALHGVGQDVALPDGGTVGGALAVGQQGIRLLGDGPVRDSLLQVWYVGADGAVVMAGGPTVKNVSGFDLCRLLVGSYGTLGFLAEVVLRTRPRPPASQWFEIPCVAPASLATQLHRPTSIMWDGTTAWVLLEGHDSDIDAEADRVGLTPCGGPPAIPDGRAVIRAHHIPELTGSFLAGVSTGVVYGLCSVTPLSTHPGALAVAERLKTGFDPDRRLNPGVVVR
jgi:glycolate oxidase FAD binding subunit